MVQILITAEAYEAIRAAFPDTSSEPASGAMVKIWLEREIVKALNQARGPSETLSDVIIRTVKA